MLLHGMCKRRNILEHAGRGSLILSPSRRKVVFNANFAPLPSSILLVGQGGFLPLAAGLQ